MDLLGRDLAFIDVETTGPIFGYHEVIEVAVVRTSPDAGVVVNNWSRQINPQHPERITEYARNLNGYGQRPWEDVEPYVLWSEFVQVSAGCVPVCHNPTFDRAFISLASSAAGIKELSLDYHWIGTESLAWPLVRQAALAEFSMAALCRHFGVLEEAQPHTAAGGAAACHTLYTRLMEQAWNR